MKRIALIAAALLAGPAQASVYATQNKDGSWTVRKYDDGNPKVQVTSRDMRKTIKVKEFKDVEVPYQSRWKWTDAGKAKKTAYEKADQEWKNAGFRVGETLELSAQRRMPNKVAYCGSGGCNFPKPGEWDRPAKPNYKRGVDFNYGTKSERVRVTKPNPNYLQPGEPEVFFSERAAKPGGLPIIGKTERMSRSDFHNYENWLYDGR